MEFIESFAFNKVGGEVEKSPSQGSNLIENDSSDSNEENKCDVYLRTKTVHFKDYFFKLQGVEIFFYKKEKPEKYDCMHSLKSSFVKEKDIETAVING